VSDRLTMLVMVGTKNKDSQRTHK